MVRAHLIPILLTACVLRSVFKILDTGLALDLCTILVCCLLVLVLVR